MPHWCGLSSHHRYQHTIPEWKECDRSWTSIHIMYIIKGKWSSIHTILEMLVSSPGSPIFSNNASTKQSSAYNPTCMQKGRSNQSCRQQNIIAPVWAVSAKNLAKKLESSGNTYKSQQSILAGHCTNAHWPCPGPVYTFIHVLSAHVHNCLSKGHLQHNVLYWGQ